MIEAAVMCLAMNIYHEARDQDLDGQMAVAEVTLNRVASSRYPDNICDVVWQNKQFSWTHDGKSDKMYEENARHLAIGLARLYISGKLESHLTFGATHYHASYVDPHWSDHYDITAEIGTHIFYK